MEHVQRLIAVLPRHKPESLRVLMVRLHRFIFFDIRWYEIEDATGNQVIPKATFSRLKTSAEMPHAYLDQSSSVWTTQRDSWFR